LLGYVLVLVLNQASLPSLPFLPLVLCELFSLITFGNSFFRFPFVSMLVMVGGSSHKVYVTAACHKLLELVGQQVWYVFYEVTRNICSEYILCCKSRGTSHTCVQSSLLQTSQAHDELELLSLVQHVPPVQQANSTATANQQTNITAAVNHQRYQLYRLYSIIIATPGLQLYHLIKLYLVQLNYYLDLVI
jgi:hypothetical protein